MFYVFFVIGALILLGFTYLLHREIRRFPGPPEWGRTPRWAKRFRVAFAAFVLLLACVIFWAFLVEPNRLVTREQTIAIDNWPKELDGLKIAVLSDIHVGGWCIDDQKMRLIIERTNKLQPEIIVILGDYMSGDSETSDRVEPEVFGPVLKELKAPLGVYSVLGNHDWWWKGQRVRDGLESNGIKVLEDEVLEVKRQGRSVWLAGLADLWTRPQRIEPTISQVPSGQPIIALTHNPDIFPRVPERVQLLLAGHTHGGQIRFPIMGTVIEPSRVSESYERGHVFENNHHLFVTTGIGTSILPIRFGVPPEIVLLTVRSKQ
ncbi:MAG TPA: metallophosphoesterase [Pyrinomonadaceae bacterium]|nr:metallophosphoesterase [Pyrinomonadaceae bacterium]